MKLSQDNAQNIVEAMSGIINQDINMMDSDGVIIASTDHQRIGHFHEGAKRAIKLKKEIIISKDNEFQGSKKGINLPVFLWDEIVGVIGITGDQEHVVKYGQIIKNMTEILLKEIYLESQSRLEKEARKHFVEELIFRKFEKVELMETRASFLSINLALPRRVLVFEITEADEIEFDKWQNLWEKVFSLIMNEFSFNSNNVVVSNGSKAIVLYVDEERNKSTAELLKKIIVKLQSAIKEKHRLQISAGVGRKCIHPQELHLSYLDAEKCLRFAKMKEDKQILFYDDLNLELLIEVLPVQVMNGFCNKVLVNNTLSKKDLETLKVFFKNNSSINAAADELYIHKNTLQYRLNKIHKLTGFNPRVFNEAVILYFSLLLQDYLVCNDFEI
ncbi:MAG: hypothetical protein GX922_05840 [Firmicutes bacterium]|nr:hypothetical protein [Bacillota bacterium]